MRWIFIPMLVVDYSEWPIPLVLKRFRLDRVTIRLVRDKRRRAGIGTRIPPVSVSEPFSKTYEPKRSVDRMISETSSFSLLEQLQPRRNGPWFSRLPVMFFSPWIRLKKVAVRSDFSPWWALSLSIDFSRNLLASYGYDTNSPPTYPSCWWKIGNGEEIDFSRTFTFMPQGGMVLSTIRTIPASNKLRYIIRFYYKVLIERVCVGIR